MEERFENPPLLTRNELDALASRRNAISSVHLALQLGAFVVCGWMLNRVSDIPLTAAIVAIAMAAIWASLFAPLHECSHRTAFRSRPLNELVIWLVGIPCGMPPSVYRAFHFAHHRHSNEPGKDPELSDDTGGWPTDVLSWLLLVSGFWHLKFKLRQLARFSVLPATRWDGFAVWAPYSRRRRMA